MARPERFYAREEVARDTIQRLVSLSERRGMATHVIWKGDNRPGFYTFHRVTGTGRHSQPGLYGPATGRTFTSRTVADCMIFENRIYREWVVSDPLAIPKQLGLDTQACARAMAQTYFDKGLLSIDIGEHRRMVGQLPPETEAELSLAVTDLEQDTLTGFTPCSTGACSARSRASMRPPASFAPSKTSAPTTA